MKVNFPSVPGASSTTQVNEIVEQVRNKLNYTPPCRLSENYKVHCRACDFQVFQCVIVENGFLPIVQKTEQHNSAVAAGPILKYS